MLLEGGLNLVGLWYVSSVVRVLITAMSMVEVFPSLYGILVIEFWGYVIGMSLLSEKSFCLLPFVLLVRQFQDVCMAFRSTQRKTFEFCVKILLSSPVFSLFWFWYMFVIRVSWILTVIVTNDVLMLISEALCSDLMLWIRRDWFWVCWSYCNIEGRWGRFCWVCFLVWEPHPGFHQDIGLWIRQGHVKCR